jgi:cyclic di-GMP phosphodiesterase
VLWIVLADGVPVRTPADGEVAVARTRRILVVDDDHPLCELVRSTFEFQGYVVDAATDVIEAERILAKCRPDSIVLDIGLPGIDGMFYLDRLREAPQTWQIPVVTISGSHEAGRASLAAGAAAFVPKPFNPLELLAVVARQTPRRREFGVGSKTKSIDPSSLHRLIEIGQRQQELLKASYTQTVGVLASALEPRDFGTTEHPRRVTAYATQLTLHVAPSLLDDPSLEWGFLLHDVGKIGIPESILRKPGQLSASELRQMQTHPILGEQLLSHIPLLSYEGLRVIRSHHERWDGTGYPDQLEGRAIPAAARIFAVVDALDAMTDDRPHRKPLGWDAAVAEIRNCSGTHFDEEIVEAFEACEPDLYRLHTQQLAA